MLKILLKIWPGLIPFAVYFFWLIIFRVLSKHLLKNSQKEKIIDAEIIKEKKPLISKNDFSLKNNTFFAVFVISCLLIIFTIIRFGTQKPAFEGKYTPAKIQQDGSIEKGKYN